MNTAKAAGEVQRPKSEAVPFPELDRSSSRRTHFVCSLIISWSASVDQLFRCTESEIVCRHEYALTWFKYALAIDRIPLLPPGNGKRS
ncbi:MAG: hypothetical protein ACI8T1_002922 [Verrucomicrobiales bacterium]|jgi:hypothetical protein